MTEHAEGFTEDDVRKRAHEISLRPDAGTADDNWLRAVDELRAERAAEAMRHGRMEPEPESPFPPNTASITHP